MCWPLQFCRSCPFWDAYVTIWSLSYIRSSKPTVYIWQRSQRNVRLNCHIQNHSPRPCGNCQAKISLDRRQWEPSMPSGCFLSECSRNNRPSWDLITIKYGVGFGKGRENIKCGRRQRERVQRGWGWTEDRDRKDEDKNWRTTTNMTTISTSRW
jgi:hypothetical protein